MRGLAWSATISIALLAQVSPGFAGEGCARVAVLYVERIEPQGFLGLLTPKADARLVAAATQAAVQKGWSLDSVCELAAARRLTKLTLVCQSDSEKGSLVRARCFASELQTAGASFADHEEHQWGYSSLSEQLSQDPHADLKNPSFRQKLYEGLISKIHFNPKGLPAVPPLEARPDAAPTGDEPIEGEE